MTDAELRSLIRQAVARHLGAASTTAAPAFAEQVVAPAARSLQPASPSPQPPAPSHYQYLTLVNVGDACLIEPSVKCNHCGYCKCHGY